MKKIPAFTILLLMAVAAVLGLFSLPMLNVQYAPPVADDSITVSYSWAEASERIVEAEVTSKIEGILSGIKNVSSVSSISEKGEGSVTLSFHKKTDMASARLEVASCIRNIYNNLPKGVSYPSISLNMRGERNRTALSYIIKSPLPSIEIEKFVSSRMIFPISAVDGVEKVSFWGASPYELEITFDSNIAEAEGITTDRILSSFNSWFSSELLGMVFSDGEILGLRLKSRGSDDIGEMPIMNKSGRIIHLRDFAEWKYKETSPSSYFRINGLNTILLSVDVSPFTNFLKTTGKVKDCMEELQQSFPEDITVNLNYDSSEYISSELDKLYFRTALCILILLLFVYVVSRSFHYLFIISTTLAVNISVAIVFYNIFSIPVHIYTLAGITVSLGIIIDTSIVMAGHYSYYRNKTVFSALLGATATTIGALCVIILLPDKDKANLEDFAKVIIINLSVALLTAYLFVPSLIDRFPVHSENKFRSLRRMRHIVKWSRFYVSYIEKGQRRRWLYILALVAAFGVPLFLLPEKTAEKIPQEERSFFQNAYNAIMSWRPYAKNKKVVDNIAGTSFALFKKSLDRADFYREPGRDALYVRAGMSEGCSVGQLNEVVKSMENYLSLFSEIEMFSTKIYSFDDAEIQIIFRQEYENTTFPSELKSKVMSMASNLGGATWRVWGVNESYFNNNINSSYKSNRIALKGYNYDELSNYADKLIDYIGQNRRVSCPERITGYGTFAGTEFSLKYDFEKMAAMGVRPQSYYKKLRSVLYSIKFPAIKTENGMTPVVLQSSMKDDFDLWHVLNSPVMADSVQVKLSEIGAIEKKRANLPIIKRNQSYEINIGFDFIGSYKLAKSYMDETVKHFNNEVLPIGYKAESISHSSFGGTGNMSYAALILLVIAVIYVMCSVTFESLRFPFAVILMIPLSFIGVFLVFGLSDFIFDKGGFAAFVMLGGIVVNAGIYLVNAFQNDRSRRSDVRKYVKAFNHKMVPIMLTIISTILGLVPFLFDGPEEVFWFPFAAGTISGMFFSVIALLFYLPVFMFSKKNSGLKNSLHLKSLKE